MNWIDSVVPWTAPKHNKWFDNLRILLGVFIFYKGVTLTQNSGELFNSLNVLLGDFTVSSGESLAQNNPYLLEISGSINFIFAFLYIYLITAHLIGGASIILGLFTRWMCLIQLPILLIAVFLVNFPKGFVSMANSIELGFSIIILIGLAYYFVMGAGENSLDAVRRRDIQQMEDHQVA